MAQRQFDMSAQDIAYIASTYQDTVKMAEMLLYEKSGMDEKIAAQHFMTSLHFYEHNIPEEVKKWFFTGMNHGSAIEFAKLKAKRILEEKI